MFLTIVISNVVIGVRYYKRWDLTENNKQQYVLVFCFNLDNDSDFFSVLTYQMPQKLWQSRFGLKRLLCFLWNVAVKFITYPLLFVYMLCIYYSNFHYFLFFDNLFMFLFKFLQKHRIKNWRIKHQDWKRSKFLFNFVWDWTSSGEILLNVKALYVIAPRSWTSELFVL